MLIRVCDLCGKPITKLEEKWEIRRVSEHPGEGVIHMDVHDECVERIMNAEKFNQLWEEAECDREFTID